MGGALYKVDFLYPSHRSNNHQPSPQLIQNNGQHHTVNINTPQVDKPQPTRRAQNELVYRTTFDDYSEYSDLSVRSEPHSQVQPKKESKVGSNITIQKKILLLPASEEGPVLLSIHKSIDEDLKVKSYVKIRSNFTSRKSSQISLNSHESKTILVKRALQPSIKEILADTPSKGECFINMEKGKQAWKLQNYAKCTEYLQKGLEACHIEHPTNYFEKGIYHRRLGANFRMLYSDEEALKHYQEALKCFSMEPQSQIIEIAAILNNIGIIYQEENKLETALDNFGRSLELKRQFLPQNHQEIALRLNNIALIQWTLGEHKKSVDSYAEALHINKIVYGYNHHDVAKNYYDLSLCLFGLGEYGLWLDYHYESLKIMKKIGLAQSADYKNWMNCFKIRMREFLATHKHQHELVVKSLGMMTLILDKDDQISFLTEIKDDLESM